MKPERFTASVFVFVICALMLSVFCGFASKKMKSINDETRPEIKIDWEKIYPFDDGSKESSMEKFSSFYDYVKSKLKDYTSTENLPGYYNMIEAAKKYEDVIRWNMVSVFDYNAVIKLKDGYLTSYTTSLDVTHDAESVKNFADFCTEKGIDFMYINFPAKVCVSEDKEISGVLDFANQNAEKFLAMLKESGVRYYDFRKNLHEAGMSHHGAFFVTDHHWKPETGLWAAGEILKILHDDFAWNIEPEILSPENFEYVIYRDLLLGSHGRKVTLARAKPEDFTVIYPKFTTSLRFEIPNLRLDASGNFGITYDMNALEKYNYSSKTYAAYSRGGHPLATFTNRLAANQKRLLLISDSFSRCMTPFLSLEIQHIDTIDLRYFSGSVHSLIGKMKPDAIIIAYCSQMPGRFGNPSESEENKKLYEKLYDFR